jgi:pimeloyl-ACP methyl ester carboxylesterase
MVLSFAVPPPIRDMRRTQRLHDRVLRTTSLSWTSDHAVLCPRYRERHDEQYTANHTAYARWLLPTGQRRRRALIYVHGWLEPGSWVEEATLFRRWTKTLDTDVIHFALPFHGRRNPSGALFSGELFWTADLVRSTEGVRQAVHDVRQLVAWLRAEGYEEVGVTGLSLGGAITMLLACLDPAPDYIIPIIAHLRLHDVVEHAPIMWRMKRDLDAWGVDSAQRRTLFERLGLSRYQPRLPAERQLWIEAREDVYIDAALVEAQWDEWGRPPICWLPGGHMTIALHVGSLTDRMARFLAEWS